MFSQTGMVPQNRQLTRKGNTIGSIGVVRRTIQRGKEKLEVKQSLVSGSHRVPQEVTSDPLPASPRDFRANGACPSGLP